MVSAPANPSVPMTEVKLTLCCERLPSGLWQGIWTYGYGPFILYKIRHIRDIHRWRLQTTLAIIFR